MPLEHIDFQIIGYWTDIKHMVIVTYFFKGNPLLPHRLLFPICAFPQTGQHITQPLMDQLWTTGSNRK